MTNTHTPDAYLGRNAVDPQGNKIGSIGQVYVNDESGVPDWVTVNTGLFGMKENFVPLQGSTLNGDDLVLPFDKDVVKDAPQVADASHLDVDESDSLYSYYRQYLTGGTRSVTGSGTDYRDTDTDYRGTDTGRTREVGTESRGAGYDTSGPTTDQAMTRSEEQLNVGTERVEAGRARLRKYVVTEQQSVTVPVSREEVRVEREPITDANRGDAFSGPEISEEEHEVVLHAEQPVVTTEAVPVERVRLGTETVTDNQTVSGEVRKEEIEVEDSTRSVSGRAADQNR
jgi:uncharacterized protein (TIGR02271 family)